VSTGPKRTSQRRNRQRITHLTAHERHAAANTGGYSLLRDEEREAIARRLRNEAGIVFAVEIITRETEIQAGRIRMHAPIEAARLSPAEIALQGRTTAAVARELLARLTHMHPALDAFVSEHLYRATGGMILDPARRLAPELEAIAAALERAAADVDRWPVKTGPARRQRDTATEVLARTLREHSEPRISAKAADALARELLELAKAGE
jgi:hypothetical protein